jgi:hypothetical protein
VAIVRMFRENRDSVGDDNDVKKCETCLRREETLMQIRLNSEKFQGACNGGGSHSRLIGWETRLNTPGTMDQEQ